MCTVVVAGPICGCEHRYSVLMDLFNATNGARWRNNSGWGTLAPCTTNWKGVTCTPMNVSSDSSSSFWYDVTAIDLGNNKLSGTLPRSLVNLTNLVILSLGVNSITGSLPAEWSEFGHLVELYLHSNTLSGTLPDAWGLESSATGGGNLSTTLKTLYLSSNSLSGSIPASWGPSLLVTLQYFFAQTNYLSGTIPDTLTGAGMNMLQIYLSSNLLSGNLPSSWKNMAQVTSIGVAGNRLNGTLPPSWGLGMKQLESLTLSSGSISGTLPAEWGEMVSLASLYLDANSMTGSLPASWGGMTSLALLYLHYNQLTGSLPMEWGALQNLTVASLNGNAFTGGLPSSWGNMISLNTLYLYSNNLTGSLPPSWAQMPSLSSLSMYSNSLRGTIPAEWGQLKKIHSIYLNMNCLYGAIPGNFSTLPLNPGGLRLCNTNVTGGGGSKLASCAGVDNPSVWPAYCSIVPQLHHTKTQTVSPPSQTSSYTSSSTRSSTRSMTTSQQHRFTLTPTVPVDSTESLPDNATTSWSPSQSYVTCAALLTTSILRDSVALSPVTSQLPTQGNIGAAEVAVLTQQQRQIITSEILISANPLGRSLLMRAPWIAMNMTLGLFPWNAMSRFSVANVTLADSRRSATTVLPLAWLVEVPHHHPLGDAATDTDKSTVDLAWFVIFAAPPSGSGGGWLGFDTPVMTDKTLQLRVTLTCDGAPAVTVAVNIPAPGSLPSLVGEVKAAVGYSQIVSVIAGGASSERCRCCSRWRCGGLRSETM
ncbi:GP46-like surface antigen, putative [Bodo saltans]|uniref:GP46-like surface antigen, putative n=1 Tax=Bodo saltans TaxID=75058 RepID=A0A0S4JU95_BODSA|nr:GP46-like surface antigen, putative [Bodo saltans]|eukprot:CUG93982.1 GP46-like surface antigen, putative [Bodo saltans]